MTEREALKLALDALEEAWYHVGTFQPTEKAIDLYDEARAAIKEVLAQPEQEPVAWMEGESVYWHTNQSLNDWIRANGTPLYTTPPQRPWVGLTDGEIMDMYNEPRSDAEMIAFGREVEAKLKEKNT